MKKPKQRHPAQRRKQIRIPELPTAAGMFASESAVGDMLDGMIRACLALTSPLTADEYRDLAPGNHLTIGEKAKFNALEDTYSPSKQQIQAALSQIHVEYEAKPKGSLEADIAAQVQIVADMIRETLSPKELAGFDAAAKEAVGPVSRGRPDPGAVFNRLLKLYLPRVDTDRLGIALHENGLSERQIMTRYPTEVGRRSAA